MSQGDTKKNRERRDFFISYTGSDRHWAEWIASQLEEAGYTLFIQAWDFRPGSNFVAEIDNAAKCAERTLLVLSPAYLESDYAFAEWTAAFRHDPKGTHQRLLPVRIELCKVDGLLGPVVYIDLVSLDEAQARECLLAGVQKERAKPAMVAFPGQNAPQELHVHTTFPGSLPTIWNIPYLRNSVFTGREQLLAQIASALKPGETVALTQPQAINGLGGVGKTQIVVEYAYRHRQDYQAVLWTLADTRESLISGYVEIAWLLNLREKDEQDQQLVVKAVQGWLKTQIGCLLIFDNADDLTLVREFLPPLYSGHILLTTRAQAMGTLAQRLEIETMDTEAGALLLLRRAAMITPDASLKAALSVDRTVACQIAEELGGLPLALDQAGAYIEETACSLADYQRLYQTRRADLLRIRGVFGDDHPQPVATTWSLSFEQVEQRNPAAADLLRLCAFLAPDAIPEEILIAGGAELGSTLAPIVTDALYLSKAIAALRAYSLITRDPQSRTLIIHRLVQAVLRDSIPAETQQQWIQRAVLAVEAAYPRPDFSNWPTCERLLPHALTCATWIEQAPLVTPNAASLLHKIASYLDDRARYVEAEPLYQRAIHILKQQLGPEHPRVTYPLNDLAKLYADQGKYAKAEPLFRQAIRILEQRLGPDHPDLVYPLNGLANLHVEQGKYAEAEPLYPRAIRILEQRLGPEHLDLIYPLNGLANLYTIQGKYAEAEPVFRQAIRILEQRLGPDHPQMAYPLTNLANLYTEQGRYAKAEPLFRQALYIREQQLGPDHPQVSYPLNGLASLYAMQEKYTKAEPLYQRAIHILEQQLGPEHPFTQDVRRNYASLLRTMGRDREANKQEEGL